MIVVTSEGLVGVDDRKSRGAGGDCESDSNQYEDFFMAASSQKEQFEPYHSHPSIRDRNYRKLRLTLCRPRSRPGTIAISPLLGVRRTFK